MAVGTAAATATASGSGFVPISIRASTSGTVASGTTATITMPTYSAGDYVLLVISRNQTSTAYTFDSNVTTATELVNAGTRRLTAIRIEPNGTPTSFVVTGSVSGVWTWWCATLIGVNAAAAVATGSNPIGSSTTAPIECPVADFGYLATGGEAVFSAASVNSSATWTVSGNTIYNTTSGNAALMVNLDATSPGAISAAPISMDRGLGGTSRNESAVTFVLQGVPAGTPNLLTNGSFELAGSGGKGAGWDEEHSTVGAATYTLTSTGVSDGAKSQRIEYVGVGSDAGGRVAIYQSPITATAGDVLRFSVDLSGALTSCYSIIGIEAFSTGMVYISEEDTVITSLTGTPTRYSVDYVCPAGTVAVAVYCQILEILPSSSCSVYLDRATLLASAPSVADGVTTTVATSTATGAATLAATAVATATATAAGTANVAGGGTVSGSATATGVAVASSLASLLATATAAATAAGSGVGVSVDSITPGAISAVYVVGPTVTSAPRASTTITGG